jgi:hypothetical protein
VKAEPAQAAAGELRAPGDEAVLAELWISFVSLVRSYVAGYDIGRNASPEVAATEGEGGERRLTIRTRGRLLALVWDLGTGRGEWTVVDVPPGGIGRSEERENGSLELSADGTVRLRDRRAQGALEFAAEALTAKMTEE